MFSMIVLSTALFTPAAPAPKTEAAPVELPGGQPPRLMELKPNADGKVTITVLRQGNMQGNVAIGVAIGGGGGAVPPPQNIVIRGAAIPEQVELSKVKDLTITTTGGKDVSIDDTVKILAKGGVVLISADGKKVPSGYLKLFKEDILVLASPELVPMNGFGGFNIQGGGIGVAPAIIPALPPVPAPAPPIKD